jgi:cytochrome P450
LEEVMPGQTTAYSPFAEAVMADPYPFYAQLRDQDPVCRVEEFVAVSRYADVVSLLRDPATFTSTRGNTREDMPQVADTTMITSDPPKHTDLRQLVNRAFTPKMVATLEPRVRAVTDSLLDAVIARQRFDVISDLAYPLPVTIIAELLGVDPEHGEDFKRWSDDSIAALGSGGSYGQADRMGESMGEFYEYFGRVIAERKSAPREDLISAMLLNAETVPDPGQLVTLCFLLLVAGHETTTNLIGNGTLALFENPDQLELLQRNPEIAASYVEEALRYDSPVQGLYRTTTRDVDVAGTTIAAGTKMLCLFASANRDGAQFRNADTFDIRRQPNIHVAFGSGVHFCLGASLARQEARIAVERMVSRLGRLRRDPDRPPVRLLNPTIRGLRSLPALFEA